jgi:hypothetical protein
MDSILSILYQHSRVVHIQHTYTQTRNETYDINNHKITQHILEKQTIKILIYPEILVCKHTTHILQTYSNISIMEIEAMRQASVLYRMTCSHLYGSALVIFNDCCIHVLELPDDGPYVTEMCNVIKIHFCCVDSLSNHFIHDLIHI